MLIHLHTLTHTPIHWKKWLAQYAINYQFDTLHNKIQSELGVNGHSTTRCAIVGCITLSATARYNSFGNCQQNQERPLLASQGNGRAVCLANTTVRQLHWLITAPRPVYNA